MDSRNRIEWFKGLILKPNVVEAMRSQRGQAHDVKSYDENEVIQAGLAFVNNLVIAVALFLESKGRFGLKKINILLYRLQQLNLPMIS